MSRLWGRLPICAQIPIACIIGPPVMLVVCALAVIAIVPVTMWVMVDGLFNPSSRDSPR